MKTSHDNGKLVSVILLALALGLVWASLAVAQPIAQVYASGSTVTFSPQTDYSKLVLTVSGGDHWFRREFTTGQTPSFTIHDERGYPLPDGGYTWELQIIPRVESLSPDEFGNARVAEDASAVERARAPHAPSQAGYFTILDGSLVSSNRMEPTSIEATGGLGEGTHTEDHVINDDLIVRASACIGWDCVNGESFGYDTIRLKENNLRIKFQDTSTIAGYASRDWQITANDSISGGANKFSIDDIDGGRTPFTLEAGAPSHSLYVDDAGRVGLGTATPVAELHSKDGDTPTLRLEQSGASGFSPHSWDVAGNETNFFIRDVTSGSKLPFRIRPSAPTSSLDISSDGDIGIGTAFPGTLPTTGGEASLHVYRNDGEASILVEEDSTTTDTRALLELANNGPVRFDLTDTSGGTDNWRFVNLLGQFQMNRAGTGFAELVIEDDGDVVIHEDLTVSGTIFGTVSSSRELKKDIAPVNAADVLAKVVSMPVSTWSYDLDEPLDSELHLGPMAEDFHAAFGLGRDDRSISLVDYSGVALAAIQGLHEEVGQRDDTIAELKAENEELRHRLERLEAAVAAMGVDGQ